MESVDSDNNEPEKIEIDSTNDSDSNDLKSSGSESDINKTPPKPKQKKAKRDCKFQDSWLNNKEFEKFIKKIDGQPHLAFCKYCNATISVRLDGVRSLTNHMKTKKHKEKLSVITTSNIVNNFFPKKDSINFNVTKAELVFTYHGVKHHQSYLSQDCGNKLQKVIYSNCEIANKIKCGRTKAEAMVEMVLAPYSLERVLKDIGESPFSIATDASNKGNKKMFPVAIRYFNKERGCENAIIDFYEDADETSDAISNKIVQCIESVGLSKNNVIAYGADNASVNFGVHKSVFVHLKRKLENPNITAGHCYAHILHNTIKNALKLLTYDVEALVLKIYAEFSSSAKNNDKLKEFCKFVGEDYCTILRHVPTRFLSLYPAVDRLLTNWTALKSYFLSKGKKCSLFTIKFYLISI